jgi:hypothetical protein
MANAYLRGLTNVKWNEVSNSLESPTRATYKQRPSINKILPKARQRKSKYLKNRYTPIIIPASGDKEDKMNAVASQKALEYAARKSQLERIYRHTVDWTISTGKGFIWLYWDNSAKALVKSFDGRGIQEELGEIVFEAGNPFEVLVPDMGLPTIGEQHEIMRVRAIPLEELKLKYGTVPGIDAVKGDVAGDDMFQYQKQIATLSTKAQTGLLGSAEKSDKELNYVVRKELFSRPCGKYPKGRYVVTASNVVLKYQEILPYGFQDDPSNPYPVVEFPDIELAGQFWPTSTVEQLISPQKEYTELRFKLINHLNKQAHPKVIASVYSKWPVDAWTEEAGEIIRIVTPPGVMEPKVIVPPAISQDLWKALATINEEIHEIASLPPVASGFSGGETSGFQVNLQQEASDSVHAPDIRGHEMAFEELYRKARKIMAQGYTTPRLISVTGRAHIPDVMEFSKDNIDENAEIIVNTGSAMSNSPAVRTQQVIELWNSGLLQDEMNPAEGKRRALTMLDANGVGEFQQEKRRAEEKARLENLRFERGEMVRPPLPFDDHMIEYQVHTDQMMSPEFDITWDDVRQKELFVHAILHAKYINPQQAVNMALEMGFVELLPMLMPPQLPGLPPPPGPGGPQPAGAAGPADQPPSGGVPPPVQAPQ